MTTPPDLAARQAAARTFDRNVVVIAGAGSGKTTLLVERVLNAVLGRGLPLPQVMALTFTEKAAAEMRARLAAQLSRVLAILPTGERSSDPASFSLAHVLAPVSGGGLGIDPGEVRRRALQALHDLDAASIGTIHAACADLLRRHPAAARLDPAFAVDDGARTERVLDEEWLAFQARTLRPDAPQSAAWRVVLASLDASVVRDAAAEMLSEGLLGAGTAKGRELALAALTEEAAELLAGCERVEALGASGNCVGWADLLARRLRLILQSGPAEYRRQALLEEADWPTMDVPSPGKKCSDPGFVSDVLKRARTLTDELLDCDEAACEAVLDLARELATTTRTRLDVEGVVGFSELLVRARDVLRDDLAVRRSAQGRIGALLLDEFQDTDPLQYEIAFLLAEDPAHPVPEVGDPWSARLRPGLLFVVGDPKQSIYRFRGADMAACTKATALLLQQGALGVSLTANFRSLPELLAPVNDLCERLIVKDEPYQTAYERLAAAREPASGRVELWSVSGGATAEAWRQAEAGAIASRLRAWKDAGEARFGDVVLLLRAMTVAECYQRALAEAGVPFVTQGGKGFFRRPEIVHAITLLRCLLRPHDGPSILAVLRSPSCGADDAEIRRFAQLAHRRWSLRAIDRFTEAEAREVPLVARTLRGLGSLADRVARLPADEAVRAVLVESPSDDGPWQPHLLALHASCRNGAQRLANLQKLAFRAESLARDEGLSLPRIVQRLEDELEHAAPHGESPLADEALDAVRIMTVHQAKGLEFGVVILPDVGREDRDLPGGNVRLAFRDGILGVRIGRTANLASRLLRSEDERHDAAEGRRLLYVALTRAKERLVVVNGNLAPRSNCTTLHDLAAGWSYSPGHAEGGGLLHEGVVHSWIAAASVEAEAERENEDVQAVGDALVAQAAAAKAMRNARRARPQSPSGVKEQRERARLADVAEPAETGVASGGETRGAAVARDGHPAGAPRTRELARALGVAVHLALEHGALDDPEALAAIAGRAAVLAAVEEGADPKRTAAAAVQMLARVPGSPLAEALRGARVLARELPFLLAGHAGRDWQGFVDLVVERDGRTWVVDWKTDAAEEPERHREQLDVYAEAVRRWRRLPEPPGRALAYVATGAWVELA